MVGGRQDIGSGGRVRGAALVGCEGGVAVRSQGVVASSARRLDAALERRVEVGRHKVAATDTCWMDAAVGRPQPEKEGLAGGHGRGVSAAMDASRWQSELCLWLVCGPWEASLHATCACAALCDSYARLAVLTTEADADVEPGVERHGMHVF
eukprot:87442-Chlamydomonas_euryale.AAC.1